jgi:hypothetical protein
MLQAVQGLQERGEIWQVTTDNMDGFAGRGTYIVVDVGQQPHEGALVLAKKGAVMLLRLHMSRKLFFISARGVQGAEAVDETTIYGVVEPETKV